MVNSNFVSTRPQYRPQNNFNRFNTYNRQPFRPFIRPPVRPFQQTNTYQQNFRRNFNSRPNFNNNFRYPRPQNSVAFQNQNNQKNNRFQNNRSKSRQRTNYRINSVLSTPLNLPIISLITIIVYLSSSFLVEAEMYNLCSIKLSSQLFSPPEKYRVKFQA